jgi:hypothetical protein
MTTPPTDESVASQLDNLDRMILRAMDVHGEPEIRVNTIIADTSGRFDRAKILARGEGPLGRYLIFFPSGIIKIRMGQEDAVAALTAAVKAQDARR